MPDPVLGVGNATGTNIPVLKRLTWTWGMWRVKLLITETRGLSRSDKWQAEGGRERMEEKLGKGHHRYQEGAF